MRSHEVWGRRIGERFFWGDGGRIGWEVVGGRRMDGFGA